MIAPRIPVLLYHSITAACDPRFAEWAVTPEEFAGHMDHLAKRGYTSLTVRDLVERVFDRRGALPDRPVVVTFDDGFADFYTAARPALLRTGVTATVFVTAGSVGGTSTWLGPLGEADRPMLSWPQIEALAAEGIEIGAHGWDHLQLDTISPHRAEADIVRSKHVLEERAGAAGPITSFAYPHGYYTAGLQRRVARAGFAAACAVRDGLSTTEDDRFALARIVIRGGTDVATFGALLRGEACDLPRERPLRRRAWRMVRCVGAESLVGRRGRD